MVFMGISGLTFDRLGLHVQVSRAAKSACVLSLDHSIALGALDRMDDGHLEWTPAAEGRRPLPVEILDTVATMI